MYCSVRNCMYNKSGTCGLDETETNENGEWIDRKTESSSEKPNNSTISKMEQVDKDKPQTDVRCEDCKFCKGVHVECDRCDKTTHSRFEPKDEPQTERSE